MAKEKLKKYMPSSIRIFLIIAGFYAVTSHVYLFIRQFLLEPNLLDYACYYVFGDVLNHGINFFRPESYDQRALDILNTPADIQIPNLIVRPRIAFAGGVSFYSPVFISLMSVFAKMNFMTSAVIWTVLNYISLIVSIIALMKALNITMDTSNLSIMSFMVFSFQPLMENTAIGQSNLLIVCMLSLALLSVKQEKPYLSGFFMAIAVLIKPQYGFVSLLFLFTRMYKPLFSTIATYVFISVGTIFIVGIDFQFDYFMGLFEVGSRTLDSTMWTGNISLLSALSRLLSGNYLYELRIIYAIIALAVIIYTARYFRMPYNRELFPLQFSWMILFLIFFIPMLEEHYLVILYIPIFTIFAHLNHLSRFWQYTFAAGFLLVALRYSAERFKLLHSGLPSLFANGKLYGAIIIAIIVIYLIKLSLKKNNKFHQFDNEVQHPTC